jgi:hypothetical protein
MRQVQKVPTSPYWPGFAALHNNGHEIGRDTALCCGALDESSGVTFQVSVIERAQDFWFCQGLVIVFLYLFDRAG